MLKKDNFSLQMEKEGGRGSVNEIKEKMVSDYGVFMSDVFNVL